MKYVHQFSSEVEAEIVQRYSSGERSMKLKEEYGCSRWAIVDIARRHGVPVNKRGNRYRAFSNEEIAEMGGLWQSGLSQHKIGQQMGVAQTIVSRVLRSAGFTTERRLVSGEKSNFWKGGRLLNGTGYWQVMISYNHPLASMRTRSGYVLEHRLVMAEKLGRPLLPGETVHHIDGDKQNNDPDNLQLRQGNHGHGVAYCCADCGSRNIVPCPVNEY